METSSFSGKNSSFRNDPWEVLERGEITWRDLDSKSRDEVVRHYAPKIRILALRLKNKLPQHVELGELISSGSLGLMEALENFRPEMKTRFTTYAENRIRGAMLDELRKMDWFSRSLRQRIRQLEEAIHRFEQNYGESPDIDHLQEQTGLTKKEIEEGLEAMQNQICLSLDSIQDSFAPADRERSETQPYQAVAQRDIIDKLAIIIDELTPREKLVLSLYYCEELNMKETAQVMSVTEGRVSQLHSQSLAKIRKKFKEYYRRGR